MRRQRQHQRRLEFVGMAAMALLGQLPGDAGIARAFMDPQMLDLLARKARQGAVDRRQCADPGIEHEQRLASAAEDLPRNLAHERLEGRNRQAAAAGIFDEGGIMAVDQRRPDQRVDLFRHPAGEPFGLNAVGIEGRWKPCCLAAAPIGRIAAAPSPMRRATSSQCHALDEMAIGVYFHSPGAPLISRRKRPSKVLP